MGGGQNSSPLFKPMVDIALIIVFARLSLLNLRYLTYSEDYSARFIVKITHQVKKVGQMAPQKRIFMKNLKDTILAMAQRK